MKKIFFLCCTIVTLAACGNKSPQHGRKGGPPPGKGHVPKATIPLKYDVVNVNPLFFIEENLLEPIKEVEYTLSGGTKTMCYLIRTKSTPGEHAMGPWCPRHIDDAKEKGGIWFDNGKVYDVDGHFVSTINTFYKDEIWKLYNDDGSIKVTLTQEECEGAAKPNVEEIYHNHCVECKPSFYDDKITTFYIPIIPVYAKESSMGRRQPLGLAFNGVNYDPPAPTDMILAAHTLAPLDDCGGHVNPHAGYHYHAVTGCTKEIEQPDDHAPMIGYALDGFGIFAELDKNNLKEENLDVCGGHEDEIRGYHYHAGDVGGNQIIGCFSGEYGGMKVE